MSDRTSDDFRVLVTGTRNGGTRWMGHVYHALMEAWKVNDKPSLTVVHGDCPTGIDKGADVVARRMGFTVEPHPADWAKLGKRAGPMRNQAMVDLGADLCLAFPMGESRGTRDCMRRAEAAGIPVEIHEITHGAI